MLTVPVWKQTVRHPGTWQHLLVSVTESGQGEMTQGGPSCGCGSKESVCRQGPGGLQADKAGSLSGKIFNPQTELTRPEPQMAAGISRVCMPNSPGKGRV